MAVYKNIVYIFQHIQLVVAIIGIVSNVLAICVFASRRLTQASYSVYFRLVALIDCFILAHAFRLWLKFVNEFDLDVLGSFWCKTNNYLPYAFGQTSLWLMTVILLDRLLIVIFRNNNRLFFLKQRWFQISVFLFVLVYSLLVHSIMPINYQLLHVTIAHKVNSNDSFNSTVHRLTCYFPEDVSQLNSCIFFFNFFLILLITTVCYVKLLSFIYNRKRLLVNRQTRRVWLLRSAISSVVYTHAMLMFKLPLIMGVFLTSSFSRDVLDMIFTIFVTISMLGHCSSFYINIFFNSAFYEEFLLIFARQRLN